MAELGGVWAEVAAAVPSSRLAPRWRGLWRRLDETVDVAASAPRLAANVEIRRFQARWDGEYAVVQNPRDLTVMRLSGEDADLAEGLDGTTSVAQLAEIAGVPVPEAVGLVEDLASTGLLEGASVDVGQLLEARLRPESRRRRFLRSLDVSWDGADRMVRFAYDHGVRLLFTPIAAVLGAIVCLAGLVAFGALVRPGAYHLRMARPGVEFLTIMALNAALIFCHEFGHAAVIVHYRRRVKAGGFRIYFGAPAFYVESSDALMLDRSQRILQAAAGVLVEFTLAAPAALYAWLHPGGALSATLYKWAVLNYLVGFMNLAPMLELDGYLIVADLLRIPDLRQRSQFVLRHRLLARRTERLDSQERALAAYALIGAAFTAGSLYLTFFFWRRLFLATTRAMWDTGLFGQLAVAALAVFLGGPLLRMAVNALRRLGRQVAWTAHCARFRWQTRWRIAAARRIDTSGLFADVPVEILNDIAGRFTRTVLPAGHTIVDAIHRQPGVIILRSGQLTELDASGRATKTFSAGETVINPAASGVADGRGLVVKRRCRAIVLDSASYRRTLAKLHSLPPSVDLVAADGELALSWA